MKNGKSYKVRPLVWRKDQFAGERFAYYAYTPKYKTKVFFGILGNDLLQVYQLIPYQGIMAVDKKVFTTVKKAVRFCEKKYYKHVIDNYLIEENDDI